SGAELTRGTLHLASGRVHIRLVEGVDLVLQAPCELELLSGGRSFLHAGTVVAHVSPSGVGFTLSTPSAVFVDLAPASASRCAKRLVKRRFSTARSQRGCTARRPSTCSPVLTPSGLIGHRTQSPTWRTTPPRLRKVGALPPVS